jgi:hypothetical protein
MAYKDHGISGTRAATGARHSTSYAVMQRIGNSTWSWPGQWTGWVAASRTWSASYQNCTPSRSTCSRQQGLDTTTPAGKAMFQMMVYLPSSSGRSLLKESVPGLRGPGVRGSDSAGLG